MSNNNTNNNNNNNNNNNTNNNTNKPFGLFRGSQRIAVVSATNTFDATAILCEESGWTKVPSDCLVRALEPQERSIGVTFQPFNSHDFFGECVFTSPSSCGKIKVGDILKGLMSPARIFEQNKDVISSFEVTKEEYQECFIKELKEAFFGGGLVVEREDGFFLVSHEKEQRVIEGFKFYHIPPFTRGIMDYLDRHEHVLVKLQEVIKEKKKEREALALQEKAEMEAQGSRLLETWGDALEALRDAAYKKKMVAAFLLDPDHFDLESVRMTLEHFGLWGEFNGGVLEDLGSKLESYFATVQDFDLSEFIFWDDLNDFCAFVDKHMRGAGL